MELSGKTALVTGASRGIGRQIAIELAKAGASVAINYKTDQAGAIETLQAIRQADRYGITIKADVSDYESVRHMLDDIVQKLGKIDILVNNAGISHIGLFIDTDINLWDNILNTNLKGTMNCCHAVLRHMLPRQSGSIINISSIWGNAGAACEAVYSASKGGINAFTKALAKELGTCGIRVNAIAPGVIDTGMNNWMSAEDKQITLDQIPMKRLGKCSEVAALAVFLASEQSSYITGQIITADGGIL